MKNALLAMMFVLSAGPALASEVCNDSVNNDYKTYIENETPNEFDQVLAIGLPYAEESILNSQELDADMKEWALELVRGQYVLLYEGMSNYMSGTELDILVVDAKTCKVIEKIFLYAE